MRQPQRAVVEGKTLAFALNVLVLVALLLFAWAARVRTQAVLLQPADLTYLGAFTLPIVDDGGYGTFDYADAVPAYYPQGDPTGPADGYPGSLYLAGHPYAGKITEVTIPVPSLSRTVSSLPRAQTLQPFAQTRGGFGGGYIMGLAYVASERRIYFTTSDDYIDSTSSCPDINPTSPTSPPTMGSFALTLNNPQAQGAWWLNVGGRVLNPYRDARYLFEVPQAVANASFQGNTLLSGRHRGWCANDGPQIFAWKPQASAPPPNRTAIPAIRLLEYGEGGAGAQGFSPANNYQGGAYATTAGGKSAVLISGVFDFDPSRTYYGYDNWKLSTQCDGIVPFPCSGGRGWRAADPHPAILFYNPDDLAAVVAGTKAASVPQPYARLDLSANLLKTYYPTELMNGSEAETAQITLDRDRGLIYLAETRVDGIRPVIHVFSLAGGGTPTPVNCVVSDWTCGPWTTCTAGSQSRDCTRTVITPAANGGTACPSLTKTDTQACTTQPPMQISSNTPVGLSYTLTLITIGEVHSVALDGVGGIMAGASCTGGSPDVYTKLVPKTQPAAGTYTHTMTGNRLDGTAYPPVSISVTVGLAPPPPPPSVGTLAVVKSVASCKFVLTGTPPDTTGGWSASFRSGTTLIGTVDTIAPYTRTTTLITGTYTFSIVWSKTGVTPVTTPGQTQICP